LTLTVILDTYGYSREDITVLKDDPNLPDTSHPTCANMVIELYSPFFRVIGADAYDSFVNSKHLLPVPHQATSSYFFVRPSRPGISTQSTHYLGSDQTPATPTNNRRITIQMKKMVRTKVCLPFSPFAGLFPM